MNTQNEKDTVIYQKYQDHISTTYPSFLKKLGILSTAVKAQGSIIEDSDGFEYIDCVSGYGVFNIGHNNPKIINDITNLLKQSQLFTNPFITNIQIQAAEKLSEISPGNMPYSFLCNSGSEAVDTAIKLARLYTGKKEIITSFNSFHGFTYGGLSATGIHSFTKLFKPLIPQIIQVPYDDINIIKKAISKDTAAVLLEPIQHEAGIHIPSDDYLRQVRQLCDEHNVLLIIDEIKTGMGKTGAMFCCNEIGIIPDILVLGKSLGGGVMPVGAMMASKKLWRKFSYSFPMAASSNSGNILACQAVISTIDILKEEKLLSECQKKGILFSNMLQQVIETSEGLLKKVDGKGMLYGVKTNSAQTTLMIVKEMIQQGILVFPSYLDAETFMIEPALVISNEQIKKVIKVLDNVCKKMVAEL
jgi:putrescine aminotransferase